MSSRAKIAETQTQTRINQLAEIQHKFNAQSSRVSEVKVRALIGKEQALVNRNGNYA